MIAVTRPRHHPRHPLLHRQGRRRHPLLPIPATEIKNLRNARKIQNV